jgi:hypothetical protein
MLQEDLVNMSEHKEKKIWKVRTVKNYPEAQNHLLIGQAVEMTESYIRLDCITYHFGKTVTTLKDIRSGSKSIRILPWNRVELINELPGSFNYAHAKLVSLEDGTVALSDGKIECVLSSFYDNKY